MRGRTKVSRDAKRRTYMLEFNKNIAFYEAHKSELLKRYRNRYVAILNQNVIDADENDTTLTRRLLQSYSDEPFLIAEVTKTPRVVQLPSVRVVAREIRG